VRPVKRIASRTVVLPTRDIDTDQIIAARFLTTTSREGLGEHLFFDLRRNKDGSPKEEFVLNKPESEGCSILVTGNNFGCGSSREHAPWALLDYGFEAVISTEIADIFRNNALKNGLVAIVVEESTHDWLLDNPGAALEIDVGRKRLKLPGGRTISFELDDFARYCLVEGLDQLGFLQKHEDRIEAFEEARTWKP
jgi:3-isopropylmalate/(R)-2-methylmalate dehydratase small subunit